MKQAAISLLISFCCAVSCVLASSVGNQSGVVFCVAGTALLSALAGVDLGVSAYKRGWLK